MKFIRCITLGSIIIISFSAQAQFFDRVNPSMDLTLAAGVASYYGDLVQKSPIFREPSFAISAGMSYNHNPHLSLRADMSFLQIKGSDAKNSRPDLIARNLSFKSLVFDINTSIEYNVLDITGEEHKFTPYIFLGVGICHFDPYTKDRNGNKVMLQPLGTEGQGLDAYPDRTPYARTILQVPFGGGIKYAISDKISLGFEFKYRYVDTDYLDDVSNAGYPDRALLAAKNPALPFLTYRADQLPGGKAYTSTNTLGLSRGNPNNKDAYYTGQFKLIYKIKRYSANDINY